MKKYQIQNSIGSGNFSNVFKGVLLPERTPCAIKVVKNYHTIARRQAQILKKFKHPNIISIIGFQQQNNQSRLILQYMGINALQLYQTPSVHGLEEYQVKSILFQIALGLSNVHSAKIIHRDIKPQNILIDKRNLIVKLIDFGLAIEENDSTTDYIATRWYRAPENLLETKQYTCAIDIFSLACVIYELYTGHPLFPGANNLQQISKILEVLGEPTQSSWPKGYQKMKELGIIAHQDPALNLRQTMSTCEPKLVDLLYKMLQLNPKKRISSIQLLKNQYFHDIKNLVPPSVYKRYQEDILLIQKEKRSLNFKGFQAVKGIKTAQSPIPRPSKINFHHVTGKTRLNQILNNQNAKNKIPEQPRLLRQQKSTSVDAYPKPNMQSVSNQKKYQNKFHPNYNIALQNCNSLRKLSSPTENSNVNLNLNLNLNLNFQFHPGQHLQKISSPSLFFNFKEQQLPKNVLTTKTQEDYKRQQQKNIEMKKNQNSQENGIKNSPQLPKLYIPSVFQHKNQNQNQNNLKTQSFHHSNSYKNLQNSSVQSYKNNYPMIPNVPFISQPRSNNNNSSFSSIPMRVPPPSLGNSGQQKKNSFHQQEQQKSISNLVLSCKPLPNKQKSFELTPPSHNNSPSYRSYDSYQFFQNLSKQESKRQGNIINESRNHIPRLAIPRQNFLSPPQNNHRIQHPVRKPDIFNKSPGHQQYKPYMMSPNARLYENFSPQNNYNFLRNNRLNAVNSPSPFYSPPQRRF